MPKVNGNFARIYSRGNAWYSCPWLSAHYDVWTRLWPTLHVRGKCLYNLPLPHPPFNSLAGVWQARRAPHNTDYRTYLLQFFTMPSSSLHSRLSSLSPLQLAGSSSSPRTRSFSPTMPLSTHARPTIKERAALRDARPRPWLQTTPAAPNTSTPAQACISPSTRLLQPGFSKGSTKPQVVLNSAPILAASRVGHNPPSRLPHRVITPPQPIVALARTLASPRVPHNPSSSQSRPRPKVSHAPILASSRVRRYPPLSTSMAPPLRSALKKGSSGTAKEKKTVIFQESRNTMRSISQCFYPDAPKWRWHEKYDPDTDTEPQKEQDLGANIAELMSKPDWTSDPRTMELIDSLLGI